MRNQDIPEEYQGRGVQYDDNDDESEERDIFPSEGEVSNRNITAKDKMQELAKKIYDSTPGIQDQFPKKQSKILQDAVENEEQGNRRAFRFMEKCE